MNTQGSSMTYKEENKMFKKWMKQFKLTTVKRREEKQLVKIGTEDGKIGHPHLTKEGWKSTFINQRINALEEFSSRIWTYLQFKEKDSFARGEELLGFIAQTDELLAEALSVLQEITSSQSQNMNVRRNGEENLPDEQVKNRRNAEIQAVLAPYKSRVATLIQQRDEYRKELNTIYGRLLEDARTTKMICTTAEKNMMQRIDIYWKAAWISHPESPEVPVIPEVYIEYSSEDAYIKPHEALMERMKKVLYKDEEDDEAAMFDVEVA